VRAADYGYRLLLVARLLGARVPYSTNNARPSSSHKHIHNPFLSTWCHFTPLFSLHHSYYAYNTTPKQQQHNLISPLSADCSNPVHWSHWLHSSWFLLYFLSFIITGCAACQISTRAPAAFDPIWHASFFPLDPEKSSIYRHLAHKQTLLLVSVDIARHLMRKHLQYCGNANRRALLHATSDICVQNARFHRSPLPISSPDPGFWGQSGTGSL